MRRAAAWLLGARPYALLIGFCVLLYLPGLAAIPPLDRDEARFAQATRQMLETGDFLHIRFQDEARNKKPAGIYWLQAASVSAFSTPAATAIWPYRLPSFVGAIAAVLLTFAFGQALFRAGDDPPVTRRIALSAALLLAAALSLVTEAHIAKTDAALLAMVAAAQGALGLAYVRSRSGAAVPVWIAAVFWGAEIAAVYLKGPPGPALAVLTAASLSIADRDWRWLRGLRPGLGLAVLVLLVAPWLAAMQSASGGEFLAESLGHDLGAKLLGAQEAHGAPPLTYLLLSIVSFWPGSWLLVPAIVRGWREKGRPVERFLLAWLVPGWVLMELVPTKLPHYVLPLYPALALLAGAALAEGARLAGRWSRRADWVVKTAWAGMTIALATLLLALPLRFAGQLVPAGAIGAAMLLVGGAFLLYRPAANPAVLAVLALAFAVPAGIAVVPRLDALWLSRSAARLIAGHRPAAGLPLVAIGYNEPSLVFLLGTDLRVAAAPAAAEMLAGGGEALVSDGEEPKFRNAMAARGLDARAIGKIGGLDYSNGHRIVLTLYDVRTD